MGYFDFDVSIVIFIEKKFKNEIWISGNPVMRNLATLEVAGLRNYHKSISRTNIRSYPNFDVLIIIIIIFFKKNEYLATL